MACILNIGDSLVRAGSRFFPRSVSFAIIAALSIAVWASAFTAAAQQPERTSPLSKPGHTLNTVQVEWFVLGFSVRNRPIYGWYFNRGAGPLVFVFAGIHGDEKASIEFGEILRRRWAYHPGVLEGRCVLLIPSANPDGIARGRRQNARGVDLNRNFPVEWKHIRSGDFSYGGPSPLSEPESVVLRDIVTQEKPVLIVSIHSRSRGKGVNNYDGPADHAASLMESHNGYEVWEEWRYPTPGSFGTYAGDELKIPTITLELPRRVSEQSEWDANIRAVESLIKGLVGGRKPSPVRSGRTAAW